MGRLCVVGLSHKTAPVEVRERFALEEEEIAVTLRRATESGGIVEAMLVSTCNRVELYAAVEAHVTVEEVARVLVEQRGLPASLRGHLYLHDGDGALRHLFRVAASLDSMVVGEPQILGQVKEAFQKASEHGTVGPLLGRTLPRAFSVAKRVRSETEIARSSASIASAAVDLAGHIFGDLATRSVLVVGAGKMGALAARHLKAAGIKDLKVINRSLARAQSLAESLGGTSAPWEDLEPLLGKVDIVICSTGATQPVIRTVDVKRVMKARRGRWLFFIDIAVSRDVEADVGKIENVYLYDVDALEEVVAQNRAGRVREAQAAEALVDEELRRHVAIERTQGVVPTLKALRSRFVEIAKAEADRTAARLPSLGEKERALVLQLGEAIANKLLHAPLTALKREAGQDGGDELAQAVRVLFNLTDEAPQAAPKDDKRVASGGGSEGPKG